MTRHNYDSAAEKCPACRKNAEEAAHLFHPESDVGPWDAICPLCRHLCCGECVERVLSAVLDEPRQK